MRHLLTTPVKKRSYLHEVTQLLQEAWVHSEGLLLQEDLYCPPHLRQEEGLLHRREQGGHQGVISHKSFRPGDGVLSDKLMR